MSLGIRLEGQIPHAGWSGSVTKGSTSAPSHTSRPGTGRERHTHQKESIPISKGSAKNVRDANASDRKDDATRHQSQKQALVEKMKAMIEGKKK
ncbi:hypothetical protein [Streptomyces halobius]|uniref:Uncharacterized protein n=1 Tax=Streptomyces halobius TaxID=2879846 RepID=A0ABY4MDR8_9ACTN|nr:hypothetical protein [Streptomyces halobius]UQA94555.1 hypothetical protein K9S39_24245 [Streptomyces halobius]